MFEQIFRNIDNVLGKEAGCASELGYTEQTSWMLFLNYLDDLGFERSQEAEMRAQKHELFHLHEAKIKNMGDARLNSGVTSQESLAQ